MVINSGAFNPYIDVPANQGKLVVTYRDPCAYYRSFPGSCGGFVHLLGRKGGPVVLVDGFGDLYDYTANGSVLTVQTPQPIEPGRYYFKLAPTFDDTVVAYYTITATFTPRPPTITAQPQSRTVPIGSSATFGVSASGESLNYQWQRNGVNIGGANAASYTIFNVQPGDAGGYRCVVSNGGGSATSDSATLTVQTPPSISVHPQNQIVSFTSNTVLSVSVSGSAPFTYQWLFNGAPIVMSEQPVFTEDFEGYVPGSNLIGQGGWSNWPAFLPTSKLVLNGGTHLPGKVLDGRSLYDPRQLHGGLRGVPVNPEGITVLRFTAFATSAPLRTHGAGVTLDSSLSGGPGLRGQWEANSVDSVGAPSTARWRFATTAGNLVTEVPGGFDAPIQLAIVADGVANEIYGIYDFGSGPMETPRSSASHADIAALKFVGIHMDQHAVTLNTSGAEIDNLTVSQAYFSGMRGERLSIANIQPHHAGNYQVVVRNDFGSITSAVAVITVPSQPPSISTQPLGLLAIEGSNAVLSATVSGTEPLTYQWLRNGVPVVPSEHTVFTEDFEDYAPGSNLIGQGGWMEELSLPGSVLTINPGTFLSSGVLDGLAPTGAGRMHAAQHEAAGNPAAITTLRFTAFATTTPQRTHVPGVYWEAETNAFTSGAAWYAYSYSGSTPTTPGWGFYLGGRDTVRIPGGFDVPAHLALVADGPAGEVYGTYDFGQGPRETPRVKVSEAVLASLNSVRLFIDHRDVSAGLSGMEIDNLTLTTSRFGGTQRERLTIANLQPGDAGNYQLVISNPFGSVTSAVARLAFTNTPVVNFISNLVWIPSGTFTMGSSANEVGHTPAEEPQTQVTLTRGFWMGKHEVTQGEYLAVMNTNPSAFIGDLHRPVEMVSWEEAVQYCDRLTQREAAAGRVPVGYAYRLPTEAEWEYACRAGTTTRFYYGDDPGYSQQTNYAWQVFNSGGTTHPVGEKAPNPWGLYDMIGNVQEFTLDWFGGYLGGSVTNPAGLTIAGTFRVIRGGDWNDFHESLRSAVRFSIRTTERFNQQGFRVVLAPDPRAPQPTPTPNFVWIPPGTFTMGWLPGENVGGASGLPRTQVVLPDGFWMGRYEVTTAEFLHVMGYNPSFFTNDLRLPVHQVSWAEAAAYCDRLNQREAAAGRLPASHAYRLPTEAEWEYACRAGTSTDFSFGASDANIAQYAWYGGNSGGVPHPVGEKLPNHWGLYDMHGNAWEWCLEQFYSDYPGGSVTNWHGATAGSLRIFRGGAWNIDARGNHSSVRGNTPEPRAWNTGFRVVLAKDTRGTLPSPSPNLVWIAPGTFTMGSPPGEAVLFQHSNAIPTHPVTLTRGFWMGKYEVTQGEYVSLMNTNPSAFRGDDRRPVEQITWFHATEYCQRLTQSERAAGRLPTGYAYRLPTEAEWEYTCRAGTTTRWSFGDSGADLSTYAWHYDNSGCNPLTNDCSNGSTHAVGLKLPNAWGLYDMHGNLGEWVLDWYGPYTPASSLDPSGPPSGSEKSFRGPAWDFGDIHTRSSSRWPYRPEWSDNSIGFRVVLAPSDAVAVVAGVTNTWRYWQNGPPPASNWFALEFNDAAWPAGPGVFYNETATLPAPKLTQLTLGRTAYYFRTHFNIATNLPVTFLSLRALIDDGAVFYLNGNELARVRMPAAPAAIGYNTFAQDTPPGGDATAFDLLTVPASALRVGENVLAVEVHQQSVNSSDIVFGAEIGLGLDLAMNGLPLIVRPPEPQTVASNGTAVFGVVAASVKPLTYQWRRDGISLSNQTNATLTLPSVHPSVTGAYDVVVSNVNGSVVSDAAILTVVIRPYFVMQPAPQINVVVEGGDATFAARVGGTPPLTFRWRRGAVYVTNETVVGDISVLTLKNLQRGSITNITLVVTNLAGSTPLSDAAWLSIMRDADGDGLGDEWELANGLNPASPLDPSLDLDGDGLTNAEEFIGGTQPTNAASTLELRSSVSAETNGMTLTFEAMPHKSYVIECVEVVSIGSSWQRVTVIVPTNQPRTVTITNELDGARQRFYRLRTPAWP